MISYCLAAHAACCMLRLEVGLKGRCHIVVCKKKKKKNRKKKILHELFPSCRIRSSPLQADQSAVVCPGQTALLLPLQLICHWPDFKLLDHCLKT